MNMAGGTESDTPAADLASLDGAVAGDCHMTWNVFSGSLLSAVSPSPSLTPRLHF